MSSVAAVFAIGYFLLSRKVARVTKVTGSDGALLYCTRRCLFCRVDPQFRLGGSFAVLLLGLFPSSAVWMMGWGVAGGDRVRSIKGSICHLVAIRPRHCYHCLVGVVLTGYLGAGRSVPLSTIVYIVLR